MFDDLEAIYARPEPFELYTADELWTDEHTSAQMLAYHLDEAVDLAPPVRLARGSLHARRLDHERVLELAEQLARLLLSVAGGLADDQIGGLAIRTDSGELEAEEGLDKGACVARKVPLGSLCPDVRART